METLSGPYNSGTLTIPGVNIARTRSFPGADIGSGHDLLMMTFRLRLKKKSASQNTQDSSLTSKNWKIPMCWKPSKLCTSHHHEQRRYRHRFNNHHLQHSSDWSSQWDPWQISSEEITLGHSEILGLCDKRRELRKKRFGPEGSEKYREMNTTTKRCMKKAKENWIGEQYV